MYPRKDHLEFLLLPEGLEGNRELENKFRQLIAGFNTHLVEVFPSQERTLRVQLRWGGLPLDQETFSEFFYVPVVAWIRELMMDPVNRQMGQLGAKEKISPRQYNAVLYLNNDIYTGVFPKGSPELVDGKVNLQFAYYQKATA